MKKNPLVLKEKESEFQDQNDLKNDFDNEQSENIELQNSNPDPGEEDQYHEYDQYGLYNQNGGDIEMLDQSLESMGYQKESQQNNTQCEMQDLVKIINKETFKVIELTGFDKYWALIYYQACGWRMNLVSFFIDEKLSSHKMISFKEGSASMSSMDGICDVCCLENQIIYKNICGDQFCQNCWKSHLKEKLKTFNTEPFPPCLNSECKVKSSPFILEEVSKSDPEFKKLYLRTLCRSYAVGNSSVKMCKGKEGFSCDRCFKVYKMFELIECECCESLVCGRCGGQYHFPSECFDGPNFRSVMQGSTNFVQNLNYRICPSCKEAVEKEVGCNYMKCKCKQDFCYTCGQKWHPNHSQHGVCHREQEIKLLNEERKRKKENEKEYTDKLERIKAEIEKYLDKIKIIEDLDVKAIKSELIARFKVISNELDYLQPLKRKLRIALRVAKGYVLSLYFKDNQVLKAELSTLVVLIQQAYDYLMFGIKDLILADSGQGKMTKDCLIMRRKLASKELIPQQYLGKSKIKMLGVIKAIDKYIHN